MTADHKAGNRALLRALVNCRPGMLSFLPSSSMGERPLSLWIESFFLSAGVISPDLAAIFSKPRSSLGIFVAIGDHPVLPELGDSPRSLLGSFLMLDRPTSS